MARSYIQDKDSPFNSIAKENVVRIFQRLFLLGMLLSSPAMAGYEKEIAPFPVTRGGNPLAMPFFGGINSPKPSMVDFDRDGLVDLLFGDGGGKLTYFRNAGSATAPIWSLVTERLGGIDIGTWHILVDMQAKPARGRTGGPR